MEKVCDKDQQKEADEDCVGFYGGQKEREKKGEKVTYLEMKATELRIVQKTQRCWRSESYVPCLHFKVQWLILIRVFQPWDFKQWTSPAVRLVLR